jgi:transcriptional regulator with GAF, ATPase, and Fis domain
MSDARDLRTRLRELIAQAREAGEFGALCDEWRQELVRAGDVLRAKDASGEPFPGRFGLIGASDAMQAVYELLEKVAPTHVSILVLGETGTGKELIARALHSASPRAEGPFQAENCAAVPANLLESELFGHVKGSFTGAIADRKGTFVTAHGGTVFLDEIGDMPLEMQSKLLRVLQDGEVRPVGSNKVTRVDVRLVAATNKDLGAMCAEKSFREDLYYRLNVITIQLPPLRERQGDVALLARFFTSRLQRELGRELVITDAALAALEAWTWPGNVRELENELQRAAVFADGPIRPQDLSPHIAGGV